MIPFNIPPYIGEEFTYIKQAIDNRKICGDGPFTKKCNRWFEDRTGSPKVLLTTSGSSALEMAAILIGLQPGDEVILPSYTFSSTANCVVLTGARCVFVDIRPDTMNIDETKIEAAITDKTRAIIPVHYAGVACEMDTIMDIAARYGLKVIEDAAQGVLSTYKGRDLGTIGDFGCFSFHETKNFSMGEGGAILINDPAFFERAEILREKGTNRSKFYRGEIDKYSWVDKGSSYLPSEMLAAYLYCQLEHAEEISVDRMRTWERYREGLSDLAAKGKIEFQCIPGECTHNAHMFYIKTADVDERTALIDHLKAHDISAVFHYVPLHSAVAGRKYGRFSGADSFTTAESLRLLRLPLYFRMSGTDVDHVIEQVKAFYG